MKGRRFDVVIACDVLYRPDCTALLETVRSVMAPGGRLVLVTPDHRPGIR